jgi:hypothetical protein
MANGGIHNPNPCPQCGNPQNSGHQPSCPVGS